MTDLSTWYRVRCDDGGVHRDVTPPGREAWCDSFSWSEIERVCFKTSGLFESDEVYVFTVGSTGSYLIPTEASGGRELVDELIRRGHFPADLMLKAAPTEGELFCWPPIGSAEQISTRLEGGPDGSVTWIRAVKGGRLEIEFYDYGATANDMFGNDVAFIATVDARHVEKAARVLLGREGDRTELMDEMKRRFASYFDVLKWLDEAGIPYSKAFDGRA